MDKRISREQNKNAKPMKGSSCVLETEIKENPRPKFKSEMDVLETKKSNPEKPCYLSQVLEEESEKSSSR